MVSLLWLVAQPVCAADAVTVNSTEQKGLEGTLLASPPGSCTAAPSGALGDCSARGAAAAAAAAGTEFFSDTGWSDLKEAPVPLTENGNTEVGLLVDGSGTVAAAGPSPAPDTDIGTSWVIAFCDHPYCGHLLRGDINGYDENGDGTFDSTWIDKNLNLVIDNGEIDRYRQEQFGWGTTSLVLAENDLGSQLAAGNAYPAGVARDRVRYALGDAAFAGSCDARLDNPACLDGDPTPANPGVDGDYWALCDPDKFNPITTSDPTITTAAEGQRALDNCLWWITSLPILTNSSLPDDCHDEFVNDSECLFADGTRPEERTEWVDQIVRKDVSSFTPDHQDFVSQVEVTYGFHGNAPVAEARYENGWQILQQDRDPNEDLNGTTNPHNGQFTAAPAGPAIDTYPYAFGLEHKSRARARGEDHDGNAVAECGGGGPDCDGLTNPTFDPFWREQLVKVALVWENRWNQEFEYKDGEPCGAACRGSGVGREVGLQFITAQDVNGYFETCINCEPHVAPLEPFPEAESRYMPYDAGWNVVPTIAHASG